MLLNYEQTLNIVEKFMTDSGIRLYCTEICRGSCCECCGDGPNACHKHEGRRLTCSMFICATLQHMLDLEPLWNNLYISTKLEVAKASRDLMCGQNPYFTPWPKELRDRFEFSEDRLSIYTNQEVIDHIKFTFINRGQELTFKYL